MTRVLLIIALVIFGCGCSAIAPWLGPRHALLGSWRFKDQGMGPLLVRFQKDYSYTVDFDGNGSADIWGEYSLFEKRIRFRDLKGKIGKMCHEAGFYYFRTEGEDLHYTLLGDQCSFRARALAVLWQRKP